MKQYFTWLGILIFLLTHHNMCGQHGLSLEYAPSKVIKHREKLLFDVPARSHEFRLAYTFQTSGEHKWERYWNKPKIAINTVMVNFGDKDVLGNAYAILPEIHFTLKQWKYLKLNLQFGTGLAHLNKPYNAISNPKNNAIGSNFNNITSFKFGLRYDWNEKWSSTLSTGLVHFSNGLSSSPNAGINIYGLSIGTLYNFGVKKPKDEVVELRSEPESSTFRRWMFDVQYHYGFTEYTVPGGPKYGVSAYSLGVGYRYTEFMTVIMGGEYEFNDERYTFFKRNFYTEQEALDQARSTIIYIENEFLFGCIFSRLRLGFYLPYPVENSRSMYTKVLAGLYLPEIKGTVRPYIGVLLKTHTAVADYMGILVGVSI